MLRLHILLPFTLDGALDLVPNFRGEKGVHAPEDLIHFRSAKRPAAEKDLGDEQDFHLGELPPLTGL